MYRQNDTGDSGWLHDVMKFGAVGDGLTNSTSAFQKVIDTCNDLSPKNMANKLLVF